VQCMGYLPSTEWRFTTKRCMRIPLSTQHVARVRSHASSQQRGFVGMQPADKEARRLRACGGDCACTLTHTTPFIIIVSFMFNVPAWLARVSHARTNNCLPHRLPVEGEFDKRRHWAQRVLCARTLLNVLWAMATMACRHVHGQWNVYARMQMAPCVN
jgi:hypothetical protein